MPTFKDINSFVQKTPDGTEKIQVSATQYVTLQQIANLASISDADIMGKKLVGFTRAPWALDLLDKVKADSTILAALKALFSAINPIPDGFHFKMVSHSDQNTGAILQMYNYTYELTGNIIYNQDKAVWGFSNDYINDQEQADAAIEGVNSISSFSNSPWTVYDGTSLTTRLSLAPNGIFNNVPYTYFNASSYQLNIGSAFLDAKEASCMIVLDSPINLEQTLIESLIFNKLRGGYGSGPIWWLNPGDITSNDTSEKGYILIQRLANHLYIKVGNLKDYAY